MNIGRIITKNKNIDTLDFVDVTENFGSVDNFVPTLIIGKQNAENIFGKEKIRVLDKNIESNIYWTFDKTEKRNEFERDLNEFNNMLVKTINKNIKYEFFNVFTEPIYRIKKLIKFIKSNNEKYIYIYNEHIYMYYQNKVYGLSLSDVKYLGINPKKVLNMFKTNKNNHITYNTDFLSNKMKKIIKDNKILIPYFYFLYK